MAILAKSERSLKLRLCGTDLQIDAISFAAKLTGHLWVALLRDAEDLLVIPLMAEESDSFLVKQHNARGDRAISAASFLRLHDIVGDLDLSFEGYWDTAYAGFRVDRAFETMAVAAGAGSRVS